MIARVERHLSSLWPRHSWWPVAPFVLYAAYSASRHDLRPEHGLFIATSAVLAYTGPRTKELYLGVFPLGLVAVMYDFMRPFQQLGLTRGRVLLCEVRSLESTLFGWRGPDGEPRTVHDWFVAHHSVPADLVCAFPYATFLLVCVACAVWLYAKDRSAMRRFAWGFFFLNVLGFVTYHLVPAGPPWYFHLHGCAVDLATRATEGPALARVDAYLGVGFFHGMYTRASSVFGALPSLHCAYPLLVVMTGWRTFGAKLRVASVTYWLLMVFAAMYLDHHWLLDAVLGGIYTVVVFTALRWIFERAPAPLTSDVHPPSGRRERSRA
jgi:hypothetical protein